MPELPDVEVFKRYLDATALKQPIARTSVRDASILSELSPRKLQRALKHQSFTSSRRHGKYLFVEVGKDRSLLFHFGMTGFIKYFKKRTKAPSHTRLSIEFENHYRLAFDCKRKLGRVRMIDSARDFVEKQGLGPDALDRHLNLARFRSCLRSADRPVKSALMSQERIAGIGNVYSDEILFHAGIHPARRCRQLDDPTLKRLYRAMKNVLRRAIHYGADPERLPDSFLLVHRAGDGRCPRCGRKLVRQKFSGRTAIYCRYDQKK